MSKQIQTLTMCRRIVQISKALLKKVSDSMRIPRFEDIMCNGS